VKVVIAGCGRVGSTLARRLSLEGHEVSVVDQDRAALGSMLSDFSGTKHCGKAFDRRTLVAAGIEHADAFVAVTSGDNSNVVSAMVAKQVFRVPQVVARIYDPRRAEIYRRLGVQAVASVTWSVHEVLALLLHSELPASITFGDGEARLVSIEVPQRWVGRTIDELSRTGEIAVVAIVRSGKSFLPTGGAAMHAGDIIHIAVADSALEHLERMLAP